ncbi:flagellar hook-associated family protein [Fulvimarina sp. MAC3]|uniref:flagellar hook-associated family protein n=1 Tax=Fulvimarina sp. MAC3 TaxID=3148887 RepID=UPI0031FD8273
MSNFLVSSLSLSGAPRASIARVQQELMIAQKEIATARYDDVGKSLGISVERTITMRAEVSNRERLMNTNTVMGQRFETMQAVLGTIADTGDNLLASLISSSAADQAARANKQVASASISQIIGGLNGNFGSRYIFSGAATDTPPMKPDIFKDFETSVASGLVDTAWNTFVAANAGGDPAQVTAAQMENFLQNDFENLFSDANWAANWSNASDSDATSRIGDNDYIQSSVSANDESFRNVVKSSVMLSKFGGDYLNDEARQVLTSTSIESLSKGLSQLTDLRSEIGLRQERVSMANDGLKVQQRVLEIAIQEEEEVDVYEAKIRIDGLMNTLEMSYSLTARMSRMSLLNYL